MKRIAEPPSNPFEIGLIAEGRHFADREKEVDRIARAFQQPGSRLVVYGDRRLGKTSALERAADLVRKEGQAVAIVSFATASDPADAARRLLLRVREVVGRNWRETLEGIAARINAGLEIRPSPVPGQPPGARIVFGLRDEEQGPKFITDVLDAINAQMEAEQRSLALGLDEFQRIHEWGGEDAEWALKAAIEQHRALTYVLAGSKRHLIEAMIGRKGRALWKQLEPLPFGPIDPEIFADWIVERATATGVRIPYPVAEEIIRLAGPRTRDIVQLARAVWDDSVRRGKAAPDAASTAMERVVREQAAVYDRIWRELNVREQQVMRAFAADRTVQILSTEAGNRFQLGPKSTVQSAVGRLVEEEHLARSESGYSYDDPLFRRWVETEALADLGLPTPLLEGPASE